MARSAAAGLLGLFLVLMLASGCSSARRTPTPTRDAVSAALAGQALTAVATLIPPGGSLIPPASVLILPDASAGAPASPTSTEGAVRPMLPVPARPRLVDLDDQATETRGEAVLGETARAPTPPERTAPPTGYPAAGWVGYRVPGTRPPPTDVQLLPTRTPRPTLTRTSTGTATITPSPTPPSRPTRTPTATRTPTETATPAVTGTVAPTPTRTLTPTRTATAARTPTRTVTRSRTPTRTRTPIRSSSFGAGR